LFDRREIRDIHLPLLSIGRRRNLVCWWFFLGLRRRDGVLIWTIAPFVAHLHSPLLDICRWRSYRRGLICWSLFDRMALI
jgi:hypothetical protein